MTLLTLQLTDQTWQKLQELAARQKCDPACVAHEILEKWLTATLPSTNPNDLSYDEWNRKFEAWLSSHSKIDVVLDDSRETIYEGR